MDIYTLSLCLLVVGRRPHGPGARALRPVPTDEEYIGQAGKSFEQANIPHGRIFSFLILWPCGHFAVHRLAGRAGQAARPSDIDSQAPLSFLFVILFGPVSYIAVTSSG